MSKNISSAKDVAFEKERVKYRKTIKELEQQLYIKDNAISNLKEEIEDKENEVANLKEWIERLLDYTNLNEEDMCRIIQKDKDTAFVVEKMHFMTSLIPKLFY